MNVSINPPGPQLYGSNYCSTSVELVVIQSRSMDISSLAAQIASANSIEDVHICGSCKRNFSDIELFVEHKTSGCSSSTQKILPSGVVTSNTQPPLGFGANNTSGNNDDNIASLGSQYLRVIFDGANINIDEDQSVEQHLSSALPCSSNTEQDILRNRLLGLSKHGDTEGSNDFQNNNELHSLVLEDQQQSVAKQREFQIDEEDVAALLANQLASEVVNTGGESSVASKPANINPKSQDNFNLQSVNVSTTTNETTTKNDSSKRISEKRKIILKSQEVSSGVQENSKWTSGIKNNKNTSNSVFTELVLPITASKDSPNIHETRVIFPDGPGGKRRYKCTWESCYFTTLHMKDLIRHMRKHTGERPFQCSLCHRDFSRLDKLQLHERIHTGEKKYSCKLCSYTTLHSSSLQKHMRVHNDERPYKCQMCSYRSRDSSQLTVHLRAHTGDNPFVCPYEDCTSAFKTNSDLKRHSRTHTGEKPFACSLCDYRCGIKSNLHIHVRHNHSETKTFTCNSCKFVCSTRREIREHEKTHAEILKCSLCSYTCVSNASMKSHLRTHCQDKSFSCKLCSFTCQLSVNLKTHMKKKHPESTRRKTKAKETSNDSKNQTGRSGKSTVHLKPFCVKSHKCTFCDAAFVREDSWRSHIRQHKNSNQNLGVLKPSTSVVAQEETARKPEENNTTETTVTVEIRSEPRKDTEPAPQDYLEINYNDNALKDNSLPQQVEKGVSENIVTSTGVDSSFVQFAVSDKNDKNDLQIIQQINHEVLDRDNASSQPILLYVQNAPVLHGSLDSSLRNGEFLTPINPPPPILVGRCGQYLSVPLDQGGSLVEQFTSSLQGMQYIVSAPFEGIVGGNTFLQPLDSSETSGNPVSVVSFQVDKSSSPPVRESRN